MDDMTAFERQLAARLQHLAGPEPPVDVMASVRAATTSRSVRQRFQTMFSATKFVVAGFIVALFGGFLLVGALTTRQDDEPLPAVAASPSTSADPERTNEPTSAPESVVTTDLLPGVDLVAEEVEPGVFRVDSDGVRALDGWNGDSMGRYNSVVAGLDGSVWLFRVDSLYRIGHDETHPWVGSTYDAWARRDDIEVAPDGTVWWADASGEGGLRSFDGESWSVRMETPLWGAIREVEIEPDGTVWVAWQDDSTEEMSVSRLGEDGFLTSRTWRVDGEFHGLSQDHGPKLSVADAGQVWVLIESEPGGDALWRLADRESDEWELADHSGYNIGRMEVTPSGTAWASNHGLAAGWDRQPTLARFDGSDWMEYARGVDGPVMQWIDHSSQARLVAAPDGSVWAATFLSDEGGCDGVMNFDGSTARPFLSGTCVHAMDVAPDGSLWLQDGGTDDRGRIYVITPDALTMTATE